MGHTVQGKTLLKNDGDNYQNNIDKNLALLVLISRKTQVKLYDKNYIVLIPPRDCLFHFDALCTNHFLQSLHRP